MSYIPMNSVLNYASPLRHSACDVHNSFTFIAIVRDCSGREGYKHSY